MADCFIIRSQETELWFNLALEAYLLSSKAEMLPFLYLWRNDRCVVIGRYQNPWAECKLENLKSDSVLLGRRQSGGGAVYQDCGNACFTFASEKKDFDKMKNFAIVSDALSLLGLNSSLSGRNDILVSGRKVSGSAFELTRTYASHHSTMLVDADLSKVDNYLTPNQTKLKSKGVKSVASRIANLTDFSPNITVEAFYSALIDTYRSHFHHEVKVLDYSKSDLSSIPELAEFYAHFSDPMWIYGKTPEFSNTIEGRIGMGTVSFNLNVEKGIITEARVFSDTLDTGIVEALEALIPGSKYESSSILSLSQTQPPLVAEALGFLSSNI